MAEEVKAAMFFAGLILLIPHRIGMSRVNYIIKRYNLPISRAGLLLYKFHNPIEVSLTIGTFFGNFIVWCGGDLFSTGTKWPKKYISILMIIFLSLMLLSSIFMFIIYVIGSDYGHLNSFYFSLILITLFDGVTNAFAFALNGLQASMLSAGIPISGALVSILHYIYKFFSDLFHWDDFDYYVLRLQLLCNILTIFITLYLWAVDLNNQSGGANPVAPIKELFGQGNNNHLLDWCPIGMLAISLGTVYAFYPSIAPYSIIDYQYASVIELWILVISAIPPLLFAILDNKNVGNYGPSGKYNTPSSATNNVTTTQTTIPANNFQVQHETAATGNPTDIHGSCKGTAANTSTNWHDYYNSATDTYTIQAGNDKYYNPYEGAGAVDNIPTSSTNKSLKFKAYQTWFYTREVKSTGINTTDGVVTISETLYPTWACVWFCAIFYILCIQIFMSMLHYPDSSLSCFFNNKYRIGFISVLFNTVRETMQACGFAGAGKQIFSKSDSVFEDYIITSISTSANPQDKGQVKLSLTGLRTINTTISKAGAPDGTNVTWTNIQLKPGSSAKIKVWKKIGGTSTNEIEEKSFNSTIAATNKLITLFVMMFCVFTGDGYLQHYRRCCRDCWPTTGYNKYQSFRYWLRCGFKGGSKSFTTSFTDMYHRNIRPQIISYA